MLALWIILFTISLTSLALSLLTFLRYKRIWLKVRRQRYAKRLETAIRARGE